MDNRNIYKEAAGMAGVCIFVNFAVNFAEGALQWAMQPDVLVDEKKCLKENFEILRTNFTK